VKEKPRAREGGGHRRDEKKRSPNREREGIVTLRGSEKARPRAYALAREEGSKGRLTGRRRKSSLAVRRLGDPYNRIKDIREIRRTTLRLSMCRENAVQVWRSEERSKCQSRRRKVHAGTHLECKKEPGVEKTRGANLETLLLPQGIEIRPQEALYHKDTSGTGRGLEHDWSNLGGGDVVSGQSLEEAITRCTTSERQRVIALDEDDGGEGASR